jgi:hypothetical protein
MREHIRTKLGGHKVETILGTELADLSKVVNYNRPKEIQALCESANSIQNPS